MSIANKSGTNIFFKSLQDTNILFRFYSFVLYSEIAMWMLSTVV